MAHYRKIYNALLSGVDKTLRKHRLLARPLRFHLEINDTCNLNCVMCARQSDAFPKDRGELPLEAIQHIAPWFQYATYVGLAGNGEPFLHRKFFPILRTITATGAVPSVITNGTLLTARAAEQLVEIGASIIIVSVDGGTKQTFEAIRRGADFHAVRDNLMTLKRIKQERGSTFPIVNFIVCLMRENISELEAIIDLAHECGACVVIIQNLLPYNPRAEASIVTDRAELARAIEQARTRAARYGIRIDHLPLGFDLDSRIENRQITSASDIKTPRNARQLFCPNIWQQFHVEVTGQVRFCCFWTKGATDSITRSTVDDIWNNRGFQELRRSLHHGEIPDDCTHCHVLSEHQPRRIVAETVHEIRELLKTRGALRKHYRNQLLVNHKGKQPAA